MKPTNSYHWQYPQQLFWLHDTILLLKRPEAQSTPSFQSKEHPENGWTLERIFIVVEINIKMNVEDWQYFSVRIKNFKGRIIQLKLRRNVNDRPSNSIHACERPLQFTCRRKWREISGHLVVCHHLSSLQSLIWKNSKYRIISIS